MYYVFVNQLYFVVVVVWQILKSRQDSDMTNDKDNKKQYVYFVYLNKEKYKLISYDTFIQSCMAYSPFGWALNRYRLTLAIFY